MKNNRGFLLAESLVVSTFVLTVLIFLFVQYQNLMTTYKNNTDYNNPEAIYNLGSFGQYLNADPSRLTSLSDSLGSNAYIRVYDKSSGGCNVNLGLGTFCDTIFNAAGAKKVIYAGSDLTNLKNYIKNNDDSYLNQSLRDFIRRIDADAIENKGRLIAQFDNGYFATVAMNTSLIGERLICTVTPVNSLKSQLVTSGDGLYSDSTEPGRYVYKGANPNNYVKFNNELWRILAINNDNLEIVKDDVLAEKKAFDEKNYRDYMSDGAGGTYCRYAYGNYQNFYGCNVWSKNNSFTDGVHIGTVLLDSSLNTYLNGTYYNSIVADYRNLIINHTFYYGAVDDETTSLQAQISDEKKYSWTGKVGLLETSDYVKSNSNTSSCGNMQSNSDASTSCYMTTYLSGSFYWLINPLYNAQDEAWSGVRNVWVVNRSMSTYTVIDTGGGIKPVVAIKVTEFVCGDGTESNPYQLS